MQAYLTLTRRELGSFFASFVGYAVLAASAFLVGFCFYSLIQKLQGDSTSIPITEVFLSFYFWLILLFTSPVITMRVFSLEKYSGTFETLMTAPVSDWQVVMAKFTASLIFYLFTWLPLAVCILILSYFTKDANLLDTHILASTFLGILLLGGLYMSLGCFASALTSSQIIAAMTSFTIGIGMFVLSFLVDQFPIHKTWITDTLSYMSMFDHMLDFGRGIIDTRYVVFYLTLTAFFLFLTYKVVESRRWK
jgi:ABC-2 type transport system permease protein